jgi:mannitol/fructose-specific phosphotransferase system IIA component (Ntr-type)
LTGWITESQIWLDFAPAGNKAAVLAALSRLAAEARDDLSQEEVLAVLAAREELGSTAVGGGVALPHGRLPGLASPMLALALAPPGGVEFDSLDGRPIRLLALLLTGTGGQEHLQLLARLGAMLKSPETVLEILAARTPSEVLELLARY